MEQNFVVLPQRHVLIVLDLRRDGHDPPGDRRNLRRIGQGDAPLRLPLRLVLADEHAGSNRFDVFQSARLGFDHC